MLRETFAGELGNAVRPVNWASTAPDIPKGNDALRKTSGNDVVLSGGPAIGLSGGVGVASGAGAIILNLTGLCGW